jgi:hypothetical protein
MLVVLTDIGLFLALIGIWLQIVDSRNEFTIKCLVAGGVFLLAGWALTQPAVPVVGGRSLPLTPPCDLAASAFGLARLFFIPC